MATWVSMLEKTDLPDQERKRISDKIKQVVLDSFEIVKKSLKKNLLISRTILCYVTDETEKELEVMFYCHIDSFINLIAVKCETCRLHPAYSDNAARTYCTILKLNFGLIFS